VAIKGTSMETKMRQSERSVVAFDVEWLLALASQHGEDEGPQSEVDDLQSLVNTGWSLLSRKQRSAVLGSDEVMAAVDLGLMSTPPTTGAKGASWLTECADLHGEGDDPDHEAGDLQEFFRAIWERMTVAQHRKMLEQGSVSDMAEAGGCGRGLVVPGRDEIDSGDWDDVLDHFGLDGSFQFSEQCSADYMNAFTLQNGVRDDEQHTQHPMKRAP
jgi:hypothetical protein